MKKISSLIDINQKTKDIGREPKPELPPLAEKVTTRLFARMALIYGHRWISIYADKDGAAQIEAEREWGRNLREFSLDDIKHGLDKCVDKFPSWPPTIGEFKRLCSPDTEEMGLPDPATAWNEILNARRVSEFGEAPWKFSHGIVLAVRNDPRCDVFNWRLLPHEKSLRNFSVIYQGYINRAQAGEVFELPVMIEDKKDRPVTQAEHKAFAKKHISGLKDALK